MGMCVLFIQKGPRDRDPMAGESTGKHGRSNMSFQSSR